MSEREKILGRIREALQMPAPVPGGHGSHETAMPDETHGFSDWLPSVGASFEDRLHLFAANAVDLRAEFHHLATRDELHAALRRMSVEAGWKRIASHQGELTDGAVTALGLRLCRTDEPYDVTELESCDIGLTECDALVAQTGSVLITSRSAGGRGLSILPPHHIVLAHRGQLLGDLPAAFVLLKRKYSDNYPSMISLVTGPSRTGDIERILVLGAHGPKKLTIFLVG